MQSKKTEYLKLLFPLENSLLVLIAYVFFILY